MDQFSNPYASPATDAFTSALSTSGAAYGRGRTPPFESARPLARRVALLLYFGMFLLLMRLLYYGAEIQILFRFEGGLGITAQESLLMVAAANVLGVLQLLARVAIFVAFLLWFRRAYRNLPPLGAEELSASSTEAVLCFFIPLLNLVRPYQLTRELWRGSDLRAVDPDHKVVFSSALVGWWWTFLWVSVLLQIAAWFTHRATELPEEVLLSIWFRLGTLAIQAIAALLAIHVVKTITANQDERFRRMQAAN